MTAAPVPAAGLDWGDPTDFANATRGGLDALSPCVVRSAEGRVDGPRAAAHRLLARWEFTDRAGRAADVWTLRLANGVLTPVRGGAPGGERPQVTARTGFDVLSGVLARRSTLAAEATAGRAEIHGDTEVLTTPFGLLQAPRPGFRLALP